ncbi:MAG: hypothetical protein AAFY88_31870, partial [Acidobacteriota bacterium]
VACLRALRRGVDAEHPGWREVASTRRRLRRAFGLKGEGPGDRGVDRRRLAMVILAADRRVVHIARRRGRRVMWSNGGTEIEVSKKSSLVAGGEEGQEEVAGVDAVAVLQTLALGLGGRDVRILATRVVPLPLSWIVDAGLGRDRLGAPQLDGDRVVARVERTYAGTVIDRREDVPTGALARQAIAELFLAGRLYRGGARERSESRRDAAALARRLAAGPGDTPYWLLPVLERFPEDVPEFDVWLMRRLEALGAESGEDVALLEVDDLLFPDLPAGVQDELDRGWPRTWSFEGVTYAVDYDLARGHVTLRPRRGKPKQLPNPFFLPRFPGLAVRSSTGSSQYGVSPG